MDHNFIAGQLDVTKCVRCKRSFDDHSDTAQCEACPNIGKCELFAGMLLCVTCFQAEQLAAQAALDANSSQEKQQERLATAKSKTIDLISEANKQDESIHLAQDIFNAKTAAIIDITKAIDADETIQNKAYTKAEFGVNRHRALQKAIFEHKQAIVDAENEQKAWQVYLNTLAEQLRVEEREKLRIHDINYPATTPKKAPKPKATGAVKAGKSTRIDAADVAKWAGKIGLPANVIHMRCLQMSMSPEEATRTLAIVMNIKLKD